jgi:hypothetical protein
MPQPWKGERFARTIRFPTRTNERLERLATEAGYANVNDYVVEIVERAEQAGLWPEPASADAQQLLPISA